MSEELQRAEARRPPESEPKVRTRLEENEWVLDEIRQLVVGNHYGDVTLQFKAGVVHTIHEGITKKRPPSGG